MSETLHGMQAIADSLGVGLRTLQEWVANGRIEVPKHPLTGKRSISVAALERIKRKLERPAIGRPPKNGRRR